MTSPKETGMSSLALGVQDYADEILDVWQVIFQVFLFHPVIIEIGVA